MANFGELFYRMWHYKYYEKTVDTISVAIRKFPNVNDGSFLNSDKNALKELKYDIKHVSYTLLADWRKTEEQNLSESERAQRSAYIEKIQNRTIKTVIFEEIRREFKEALKRGNWAAILFLNRHHQHLSHIRFWPLQMRHAISLIMQEMIIPQYANNIQGFVTGGAAFLIVSIGLRTIGASVFEGGSFGWLARAIENNLLVYIALSLEFGLLLLYSITIFYTHESRNPSEESTKAPADAAPTEILGILRDMNAGIQGLNTAVTSLNTTLAGQDQLKLVKKQLESALEAINAAEKRHKP